MKFTINREALLKPLQLIAGVVERRQTMPVLSNVLMVVDQDQLSLTGTDLEVELVGHVAVEAGSIGGEITVPARKLMDICKSLPDNAMIQVALDDNKVLVKAGRSRFTLSTLPAQDFPNTEEESGSLVFEMPQARLRRLLDRTSFAMAQQDVRYYLNGMLIEVNTNSLRAVATDGHRLAMCSVEAGIDISEKLQVIVPRKGIMEMARLLVDGDEPVYITLGANHIRARTGDFIFTSKLVDGKFPDYARVIPRNGNKVLVGDRQTLRQAFQRASILSNEKFRGIRLLLSNSQLKVLANNPDQEEAEEELMLDYQGDAIEIGFNVGYLLDALSVLSGEQVKITLSDPNSSALLEESEAGDAVYVVMPMRL